MDDQIKIGTNILDSVNKLSNIVKLVGEVSAEYKKSASDFVANYEGGANENIKYLQNSLQNDLDLLTLYYSVAASSIQYALEEFIGQDEALAKTINAKFEEMIS